MQTVLQSRGVAVAIALLLYIQPKTSSSAVRRWRLIVVTSIYAGLGIRLAGDNLMYAREKEKIKVQLACEGNLWPQAHEREKEKRGGKFVAQTHVREKEKIVTFPRLGGGKHVDRRQDAREKVKNVTLRGTWWARTNGYDSLRRIELNGYD
jgi:hypothetical protein